MLAKRLIKSNDAGGGACTNTVNLYNPFPDGGGVALYQLNGDATDVSGNYDGTASNVTYSTGVFGQAGSFNGTTSQIDTNNNNNYTTFTFSAWVKFDSTAANYQTIYGQDSAHASLGAFYIGYSNDIGKRLGVTISQSSGSVIIADSGITPVAGTWYNVVGIVTPTNAKIYIDGVYKNEVNYSSRYAGTGNSVIGGGYFNNSVVDRVNGSIDQVRIFSRALRPYEVEALYTEEYCTPTIVPSEHFNTVTYDGNGSTQSITGVGFEPDLVWIKERNGTNAHYLQDSVRGNTKTLNSNETYAEGTVTNGVTSFNADGFSLGNSIAYNRSSYTYVSWNFKAGGAAVDNNLGERTVQVSANVEAGFSIVKADDFSNLTGKEMGHGLGAVPKMIIAKPREGTFGWPVYHESLGYNDILLLNTTDAAFSNTSWQYSTFTTETFSYQLSNTAYDMIFYVFAEVEGFSSFGSYVGTGASGNTIVTGFEPAFVMMKKTSGTTNAHWQILDNKRNPNNPVNRELYANLSGAENQLNRNVNFLENGFELTSSAYTNDSGASYIYMAFAADPTTIEPTLEDSFNTVTYTGNGTDGRQITGVGFQPDLVWLKNRDTTNFHQLLDSVRGAGNRLFSNATNAESFATDTLQSFNSDGFTVGTDNDVNGSGYDIVAWCWKGAELPAINSNGSIPSVVSANPAAGFSIVSWSGNSTTSTIGHGLNSAPKMIISKDRNFTERWNIFHASVGTGKYLQFTTAAAASFANAWPTLPDENVWYMTNWENTTGHNYISYVFAEVAGFSKFGSYTGQSGDTSGYINCGFEPAFVMYKRYDGGGGDWYMVDNKRGTTKFLRAHSSAAEATFNQVTFDSTGFTITGSTATNGESSIYMAFANQF
jgi:hypothetical protein